MLELSNPCSSSSLKARGFGVIYVRRRRNLQVFYELRQRDTPDATSNPSNSDGQGSKWNLLRLIRRIPEWADAQKEQNMPRRRASAYYSNNDWLRHRSSLRHARHIASSLSSRVIISLIPPVFTVTGISVLITVYNLVVLSGWVPSFLPLFHAPSLPYELTAPALALLLVFRTDTSFSRYDEARKTWTEVISGTKNLARLSMAWIQDPKDLKLKKDLMQYIIAFPLALKCHLIYGSQMEQDLKGILKERDLAFVLSAKHRPNCLIQLIFQSINTLKLGETQQVLLNENISNFNRSISVCERLIRTPIPLSYTRLTSRFLIVWHLALPLVLWDECNWVVIPSTFFSAAALFCIEEVGVLIEEPFPILPLDRMCEVAHDNIMEMLDLQTQVEEHLVGTTTRAQDTSRGATNGGWRNTN